MTSSFDLQSHRGGRGVLTEESLAAFGYSLDLGVTTLELDIVLSRDGVPLVWHDPELLDTKCRDTQPATPQDPNFPYVGKDVRTLSAEQLATVSCDIALADFPGQTAVRGNRIATLDDVFELCARRDATVHFNIETKIEAAHPDRSASPQEFVDAIAASIARAGVAERVVLQSFDWSSLPLMREKFPTIRLAALYDATTYFEGSPWLGPVSYTPDPLDAIAALGAQISSPDHELVDRDYVRRAHALGLKVLPWTVNEVPRMNELIEFGCDGIITDYPARLRSVMHHRGMPLPEAFPG